MNETAAPDRIAVLEAGAERLRSAGAELMACDVAAMATWGGVWFARHLLKGVGDALVRVSQTVSKLVVVRDVPWAVAARHALYRALCRVEEANWAAGVIVEEWERPFPSWSTLPAVEVGVVSGAVADAAGELDATLRTTAPAELSQAQAVRLITVVGRIVAVLSEVVAAVRDAPVEDGQSEVRVVDVCDRVHTARVELTLAAGDARSAGGPGGEQWLLRDVRRHVLAVRGCRVNAEAVGEAGVGNWLDEENGSRRVRVAADAVRALDSVAGYVQLGAGMRWRGDGERVLRAREALARAASLLGFAAGAGVAAPTRGPIHASLIVWQGAVTALASVARDGSGVAYQCAARGASIQEILEWFGEIVDAVYAIVPGVVLVGACARGTQVPALMSKVAEALGEACGQLEEHVGTYPKGTTS